MDRAVLVVDDDASVARLVGTVLSREGHAIELAHDGPAALRRLQQGGVALVLTDMTMPGMSGLELVRASEAAGLGIPFLLMSAYLDPVTERTLFAEPGIAGLLRKPFEIGRLIADVRAALSAARPETALAPAAALAPRAAAEPCAPCATLALVPLHVFRPWIRAAGETAPAAWPAAAPPVLAGAAAAGRGARAPLATC